MLQFKYPGVYTQEIPSGVRTISGAPTSVALFVGPTLTGIDGRPTIIQNFGDFERSFGGLSQKSSLSYSVLHFFANGGGEAYVIRVPVDAAVKAATTLKQDDAGGAASLTLTALSSGLGGTEIYAEIDPFGIGADPYGASPIKTIYNLSLFDRLTGRTERFGGIKTASGDARTAQTVVNDVGTGSKLVALSTLSFGLPRPEPTGSIYAVGALPAAGTYAKDVVLNVAVDVRDAAGAAAAGQSLAATTVVVFPVGSAKPQTPLELITRMAAAINAKLREPAPALVMEGVGIEAELFEGGKFFRLRTAGPGPTLPTKRLHDATVTIADIGSAPAGTDKFGTVVFAVAEKVANPSRYRIGAPYTFTGNEVSAATAGADGNVSGQPKTDDFKAAVMALDTPDPFFNTLCLPDLVRPSATDPNALHHPSAMSIYGEAALICRKKFAFLLIDPFPGLNDVGAAESWKTTTFTFQSSHAAAYFPNIRVDDPLVAGSIRAHPPSGALAGLYARTDGNVGVWQAPAGTEASLTGVYGPSVVLSDGQHGMLNPLGLNVIRLFPIFGTVSFGSRTVDGSNALASEWKYIPVRRTANYILRSLSEGLRWAVHKPNGDTLWAELRMNVTSFMQGLFRQGAFKGTSPRDAFFVQCDASTTTQADIDLGIVNIIIGFAPLKPAEFVVISLKQIVKPAA
jgi:phage tail sheath protein FI